MKDQMEVRTCDKSAPACAWGDVGRSRNPYPFHYKTAFAFSILLYPHLHRLALRLAFPAHVLQPGEVWAYLVPCEYQNGLGLAYSPVALRLRQIITQHLHLTTCLLAQACQHLGLARIHDVYQRFTFVDHTIQP